MAAFLSHDYAVEIESAYITKTYMELLEGKASDELNQNYLNKRLKEIEMLWGKRNILFPQGLANIKKTKLGFYPPIFAAAWLTSSKPINSNYCGSHLFAVWLFDKEQLDKLHSFVLEWLKDLDWKSHAQDFDP